MSKGFDEAEAQVLANQKTFTRDFFLKSGEEVVGVRVLDPEPVNIRAHFVKGKGWFTCIQGIENCPLCEEAGKQGSPVGKAQNQFIFNVLDPREYTSEKTGETYKNQVKLWRVGITLLRMLNKKRSKYGPLDTCSLEISKMGSGQSTAWNIEVDNAEPVTLSEDQELYDLEEVLAPKSRAELLAIFSMSEEVSEDDDEEEVDWRK